MKRHLDIKFFIFFLPFILHGCGKQSPIQPGTGTIIFGSDSLTAIANSVSVNFVFRGSGINYGGFSYWVRGPTPQGIYQKFFGARGIQSGTGVVAPPDGYGTESEISYGQYFIISDDVPHFARVTVTKIDEEIPKIKVVFDWVLQTDGGNRNIY